MVGAQPPFLYATACRPPYGRDDECVRGGWFPASGFLVASGSTATVVPPSSLLEPAWQHVPTKSMRLFVKILEVVQINRRAEPVIDVQMNCLLETALKERAQVEAANFLEQILCLGQAKGKAQ